MYHTDKYSQHSSIIWSIWLNGWVSVYEPSGCGFKSHYSHLKFVDLAGDVADLTLLRILLVIFQKSKQVAIKDFLLC